MALVHDGLMVLAASLFTAVLSEGMNLEVLLGV
jgi:hypothetical protein